MPAKAPVERLSRAQLNNILRQLGVPEETVLRVASSGAPSNINALSAAGLSNLTDTILAVANERLGTADRSWRAAWGGRTDTEYNFFEALRRRGVTADQITQARDLAGTKGMEPSALARALVAIGVNPALINSSLTFAQVPGPAGTGALATVEEMETQLGSLRPRAAERGMAPAAPAAPPPGAPTVGPRGAPGRAAGLPGAPSPAVGVPAPTPTPTQPSVAAQVAAGISAGLKAGLPKPATPEEIRAEVNAMYGWAAGLADIPEIAKILDDAATGKISKAEVGNRFRSTNYYKTTTEAGRNWRILERTAPADAALSRSDRLADVTNLAKGIGMTDMDPRRLQQLTDLSLQYGWNDTQINQFLANEIHFDPTRAKTGMLATMKEAQRQYLVPLSDAAMSSWASAVVAGTKTAEEFDRYLRDSASSLFPALGEALKDPNMTTRKYLDPYGQVIAKTLGGNAEDIDWLDPKYQRFVTQVDPKTNQRTVMPLADVQRTLMVDPLYGYDKTTQGQQAKASFSAGLLKTFGFAS